MAIADRNELKEWLDGKPSDWAKIVAARTALRALPYLHNAQPQWLAGLGSPPIRAAAISWAARNIPSRNMAYAVHAAYEAASAHAVYTAADTSADAAARTAGDTSAYAAFTAAAVDAAAAAAAAAYTVDYAVNTVAHAAADSTYAVDTVAAFWMAISGDCDWLDLHESELDAARVLSRRSLWLGQRPDWWRAEQLRFEQALRNLDQGYDIWLNWFERRVRGERAGFDIPGDRYRKEDKAILIRLAEATDEDFWSKGAAYVNATLQGWIDEARERVAGLETDELPEAIPQDRLAIAYGLDTEGKLDRLPLADQERLHDLPGQRRAYVDIRAAMIELRGQGQMLGGRLQAILDRAIGSTPEDFAAAETYLVWRDWNALRRLHRAHETAPTDEPSEARLDSGVAEDLGGILDLANNFAFADHGLRERDERRTAPQVRDDGAAQQTAGAPLIDAALAYPDIATAVALGDIRAERENEGLPGADVLADQARDQGNRTIGNWFAGLLSGALETVGREGVLFGEHVRSVSRAGEGVIVAAVTGGLVSAFGPVVAFVVAHEQELRLFASLAYQGDSALRIIDYIVARGRAGR